ncbi:alkaline phosphatase D family protein [Pseudoduganella namucuonensis]|uniref:PhoD-like phosphatase n=1 Tax=Pseudoduganella namucuonensis TaxID=1035707 RepID=A0A1I7GHL5_9BURK|nr:alkaline phosphatase D family protein [Pseudoduganella namucuonensis]SFU47967.1 PhoD-like phosphatase [Pseudoduganella namucuonensis]
MTTMLGPVLKFRGVVEDAWVVSILLAHPVASFPDVSCLDSPVHFTPLGSRTEDGVDYDIRSYAIHIPQTDAQREITYRVGARAFSLIVPPTGGAPTCAYTSCNGYSDPKVVKKIKDLNAMWSRMAERHRQRPYNLLLMGGDQIYSDAMWEKLPTLKEWGRLSYDERNLAPFTPDMGAEVESFFFTNYLSRWSEPAVAAMLASVPTAMMWDDHDIFDGWGSYADAQQDSPVFKGIHAIAKRYFELFQLHSSTDAPCALTLPGQPGHSYGLRVGEYGILALDLRSERTPKMVMGAAAWEAAYAWLERQQHCKHMLVMSSIPVVHPDFSTLETLLCAIPGRQELEDDLQDHWLSHSHRKERLRLIHRLLEWSARKECRVTLLSGDVHVGALGVIESDRKDVPQNAGVINQLTSSGIVHPAPPAMALFYLEHVGDRVEPVDRDITATMYPFPGTSHRYIGARNYLSLEPDLPGESPENPQKNRIWANWWVEGMDEPYTKTIHAVGKG